MACKSVYCFDQKGGFDFCLSLIIAYIYSLCHRSLGSLFLFPFQFAHDLCDVHRATCCKFGLLFFLLLSEDDGTQAGPPSLGILLQLHLTRRHLKRVKNMFNVTCALENSVRN